MRFFTWLGMTSCAAFFIWFTFFGAFFLYDEAGGRKAALGFMTPHSDAAGLIVLPVILTFVAAILLVFLEEKP